MVLWAGLVEGMCTKLKKIMLWAVNVTLINNNSIAGGHVILHRP